jgi:hypothetical protein
MIFPHYRMLWLFYECGPISEGMGKAGGRAFEASRV